MRRFLTTLAILLVVLVAGMTALVVLVNPNDFRAYMVKQVEERSGYRLQLDGDLRWHVWPQLSILSGGMSLSAPGSSAPIVSAENMRLDVQLWPLLSHKLAVKQVMLKGAIIRLTPESEAKQANNAPIAPAGSQAPSEERRWRLDIDKIKVADSLLILQRSNNEQINVRDINLAMEQNSDRQVNIELSSRINRDQRDIAFSLAADVDLLHFPQQVNANVTKLDFQLQGAEIPPGGISGTGSVQASYQQQPEKITFSQLSLNTNNSQLSGAGSVTLGDIPHYDLDLLSEKLDLDSLLGIEVVKGNSTSKAPVKSSTPVISNESGLTKPESALQAFTARLSLQAATMIYRGLDVRQFTLRAENQPGLLDITTLSGELGSGHFSLPGKVVTKPSTNITLRPELKDVELSQLMSAFALPAETVSGKLSMAGQFSGNSFSLPALLQQWQGTATLQANSVRLQGLNIQQMVQMAVARSNGNVRGQERYERYTELQQLTGKAQLNAGKLRLTDLNGRSELLSLSGVGQFDLPAQTCDVNVNVSITQGWQGDEQLVSVLKNTAIPLRVYGEWDKLNYQLQVDQLLRKRLQDELKKRLNDWASQNQQSQKGKDLKQLLDRL
ncbi:outer membrane assembly protein AsmA [Pectobacterium aroidearum]|uniref:Outer membrane assembly protein AsmA n=1 Tax=Pectobacterium aroidearum TaxID=1201031 RepID=A0ABR5ZD25_9GAMM|nr:MULTISPECIES: outer membrane assembly protein AsmA [Pectobacterium]MBA5199692.1 outer membrane assembly protein AsmA [Pectobacterium aroidearum]MBA5228316.1 outer membrane assembly protein AsmA [Pectobacterium aroidearum]MBA5232484.1 outer membrane assembly protein AsmA [Pectobacterium aroidearum]MBA5737840.1 outer membrane assembly protein AsmA [Pectobacterium aroidearum]UXK01620.1 outer membrane assembly protein AsmA [Pectobacterium aroidearum]